MNSQLRQYSIRELARAVNISEKTLRKWRDKGWLQPTSNPGTYPKYSEEAFKTACERSLKQTHEIPTPDDQSVYRAAIGQ